MGLFIAAAIMFGIFVGIAKLINIGANKVDDIRRSDAVLHLKYNKDFRMVVSTWLMDFSYYVKLSPEGKDRFVNRTLLFHSNLEIIGHEGYEPDDSMRIHVCATAAQLSFHLDKEWLASFTTVVMHPGNFRMRQNGPLMKGATTPNGIIRISAKDYVEGYRVTNDKLNLGLHEFAHALLIEFSDSANNFEDMRALILPYEVLAEKEISEGFDGEHLLRKYAFTNKHEFFSVCVETFFEAPHDFVNEHPELYGIISRILNQDARNAHIDYKRQLPDDLKSTGL